MPKAVFCTRYRVKSASFALDSALRAALGRDAAMAMIAVGARAPIPSRQADGRASRRPLLQSASQTPLYTVWSVKRLYVRTYHRESTLNITYFLYGNSMFLKKYYKNVLETLSVLV